MVGGLVIVSGGDIFRFDGVVGTGRGGDIVSTPGEGLDFALSIDDMEDVEDFAFALSVDDVEDVEDFAFAFALAIDDVEDVEDLLLGIFRLRRLLRAAIASCAKFA